MTRPMPSQSPRNLKVRHFLLQAKAQADTRGRAGAASLTDTEIRELMESIWIAERALKNPELSLAKLADAYTLADWAQRENSPDQMERALTRASAFYDTLYGDQHPRLI